MSNIGPELVQIALGLRRNHPNTPAAEVLDVCMRQRSGRVTDLGEEAIQEGSAFARFLVEALDMQGQDWCSVLQRLAEKYGLDR